MVHAKHQGAPRPSHLRALFFKSRRRHPRCSRDWSSDVCSSDLLDLGIVGNSSVSALISATGEICWTCLPRVDGDPVFCSLLRERSDEKDFGFLAVDLEGMARAEQAYLPHTAVLVPQ